MNLRQAQRVLAELVSKCEAAHIQLPKDPIDARMRSIEALRHSRVDGKVSVNDAMEELQQSLGLEPQWQQKLQEDADKLHRRQLAGAKKKTTKKTSVVRGASPPTNARAKSVNSTTSEESDGKPSRVQAIKKRNPAKNPANKALADEFVDLGGLELKRGETQKGISRMKVAKEIRNLEEPVTSGAQVKKIRGVGPSAAAKVDEFLDSGAIHELEEFGDEEEDSQDGEEAAEPGDEGDRSGMPDFGQEEVKGDDELEYDDQPDDESQDMEEQQV